MPFIVIFGAGLIVSVIQRYARDICLLEFNGDYALVQMKSGRWIFGNIDVHSKALVIVYPDPLPGSEGEEHLTHILYEQNMGEITLILRPEPAPGSPEYERWMREIEKLRNPPLLRRVKRRLRNVFNMLRNAFSESIAAAIGIVKQRTAMGRIAGVDQKANEIGQKLLTSVPASYEPILEHYLSREVTVETVKDLANPAAGVLERTGVFEEYSDKFILIRDVFIKDGFPAEALRSEDAKHRFAVIVPRTTSAVRHLSRRVNRFELVS
jgi:hypothetical protein